MGDFGGDVRSCQSSKRGRAKRMEPVVDPAGWSPEHLRDVADWSYRICDREAEELAAGVAAVRRNGVPIVEVARENFPLAALADALSAVRAESPRRPPTVKSPAGARKHTASLP